ncbi:MAG TPA: hypothetical protein DD400_05345 [Rhodospirillaceae bacterium]|nr:hypothetical protein [Rhodospirillaceae bacterium]
MRLLVFLSIALWAFSTSALLTKRVCKKLLEHAILDQPNARSMHTAPVPRGGGLAVIAVLGLGLIFLLPFSFLPALYLFLATGILSLVGWYDDKKGASISLRLSAHLLAATLGCFALEPHAVFFEDLLPFWLDRGLIILGWVWFMNLYNFMDGIDGITSIQSICCALGIALILLISIETAFLPFALAALTIGSCGGFLLFNWHPAKVFLGDVGSVPLGFIVGFLLLTIGIQGYPWAALILPLYYLADSGITLTKRLLRREKIWKPHRQHFYQLAAASIGNHHRVVLWILLTNIALIALSLFSLFSSLWAFFISLIVVALLLKKMHKSAKKVESS